jgi:hypothetical protein
MAHIAHLILFVNDIDNKAREEEKSAERRTAEISMIRAFWSRVVLIGFPRS